MKEYFTKDFLVRVVCHPSFFGRVSVLFILAEMVINVLVIQNIKCEYVSREGKKKRKIEAGFKVFI